MYAAAPRARMVIFLIRRHSRRRRSRFFLYYTSHTRYIIYIHRTARYNRNKLGPRARVSVLVVFSALSIIYVYTIYYIMLYIIRDKYTRFAARPLYGGH